MILRLRRTIVIEDVTMGELWIDSVRFAWTLEDPIREQVNEQGWCWRPEFKVPRNTAIPSGRYPVEVTWSHRFQRPMPLIGDVPDFQGIRIHGGNDVDDTEGCPLIARQRDIQSARIWNTAGLLDRLVARIEAAPHCTIEVTNP